MTAQTNDGLVLAYGPSPAGATRVTLSMPSINGTDCRASVLPPMTVTITHRLPSWNPVARAGWFATEVPAGAVECVIDATFVDAHGRTVKQPNNF